MTVLSKLEQRFLDEAKREQLAETFYPLFSSESHFIYPEKQDKKVSAWWLVLVVMLAIFAGLGVYALAQMFI